MSKRGKRKECQTQAQECCRGAKYICAMCGTQKGLKHAHHIIHWVESKILRKDARNLICLCVKCHRYAHTHRDAFDGWLDQTFPGKRVALRTRATDFKPTRCRVNPKIRHNQPSEVYWPKLQPLTGGLAKNPKSMRSL